MTLGPLDTAIVIAFVLTSLAVGSFAARGAGRGFAAYFLAERSLPGWLLGVSMVATTFSTDTPGLVTDIVRSHGVIGNWIWWSFLLTGLSTTFLYARLWQRSGLSTDAEFYELRYSGLLATALRGFRAVYLGAVFNILIMASVLLAAVKFAGVLLGLSPLATVAIGGGVVAAYSMLGGLRGVVWADLLQFGFAMVGSISAAVAIVGLPEVGGMTSLLGHPEVAPRLAFLPTRATDADLLVAVFVVPLAVQWWASYYPGAEPGGGGYVAQRMLAARDERAALGGTLLFNVLHYAVRPWPWILVALASLVVFPDLDALRERFPELPAAIVKHDLAYPAMLTFLREGHLGLVVASLAAAFMSTMSTQANWGASLLVNDVYVRFVDPNATERQQVRAGRIATLLLVGLAALLALRFENALEIFGTVLQIGAGTGLLFMLRWYWRRVNALAEFVAMAVSLALAIAFQLGFAPELDIHQRLLVGVGLTTTAWVCAALFGPATEPDRLLAFERRLGQTRIASGVIATLVGSIGIWSALFATGFALYGNPRPALAWAAISLSGLALLWRTRAHR